MEQKPSFGQKYPALKDILNFLIFVGAVALGTFILNRSVLHTLKSRNIYQSVVKLLCLQMVAPLV